MLLEPLAEMRAHKLAGGHPGDPVLARFFGLSEVAGGVDVNENTAMNYSAVWAATRILSGTGGMIPLKLYRRLKAGGKEEAFDRSEYHVAHSRPNPEMGPMMFRSTRIAQQVNGGNGYAEIERNGARRGVNTWPIHCSRMKPYRTEDRSLWYEVTNNDGTTGHLPAEDVLHFPYVLSDDGICGKGVIAYARESIGFGLATERHGASYFGNGARPGVVVTHPKVMSKEARTNFRSEWNEIYQGPNNAHKMALLSEGADIKTLGFSPEDSQFLASREHNVNEFSRWYGVPPHLLGDLRRATFSNIDHQSLEYVIYSMMPLCVIIEQEYNRKLLSERDQETLFFEHVFDGLLRGDALARAQKLQLEFQNGAITIDEWRAIENRNPLPDGLGQKHFVPLNMTTVENAGKPPEPKPVAEPVKEPEREEEARSLPAALASAHRDVLCQVFGRLLRKEAQAARRAANKPEDFLSWLDTFYVEHESYFASEIGPVVRAVSAICGELRQPEQIAKLHCEQARSELLEASGVPPEKFKDEVERCAVAWESTAPQTLADEEFSYLTGEQRCQRQSAA